MRTEDSKLLEVTFPSGSQQQATFAQSFSPKHGLLGECRFTSAWPLIISSPVRQSVAARWAKTIKGLFINTEIKISEWSQLCCSVHQVHSQRGWQWLRLSLLYLADYKLSPLPRTPNFVICCRKTTGFYVLILLQSQCDWHSRKKPGYINFSSFLLFIVEPSVYI